MKERFFKTEADLCAAFIAWATPQGVQCYAEWWGWDILLVYPDGLQLGIQAKLRLNAEVIGQASPGRWHWDHDQGPDYRGVLVPESSGLAGIAARLGLVVFTHYPMYGREGRVFSPSLDGRNFRDGDDEGWLDWSPGRRHDLPAVPTDSIAGSPCPVTLTHWKLAALDVLAELEVKGAITRKRIRELGCDPRRWLQYRWLVPAEKDGDWIRGERCPRFEEQHPSAWALALEKARKGADEKGRLRSVIGWLVRVHLRRLDRPESTAGSTGDALEARPHDRAAAFEVRAFCARCVELVPRLRFSLDESIEALQDAAEFVERLATLVAATGPAQHRKHARQIRNRAAAMRVLSIQLLGGS